MPSCLLDLTTNRLNLKFLVPMKVKEPKTTNRGNQTNLTQSSSTRSNRRKKIVLVYLEMAQTRKIRARKLTLLRRVRTRFNKVQLRVLHSQVQPRNQPNRVRLRMNLKLTLRTHRMVHQSHRSKGHQKLAFQSQVSRNLANRSQASKSNNPNSQSNQDSKKKTSKSLIQIHQTSTHAFQGELAITYRAKQTTCLFEGLW